MIPRLIFISILILSLNCEKFQLKDINLKSKNVDKTKIYSINELVKDTLSYIKDKNYNLFDPNEYITPYHNQIRNKMIEIYNLKKVKVYYFYVHDIKEGSYNFLSNTMKLIGRKMGDPNGNYFLSFLFIMNSNKYFYRIGGRVGTKEQKKFLETKIKDYIKNFESSVKKGKLGDFSVELLENIKPYIKYKISNSSNSFTGILISLFFGIILIIIFILIFITYCGDGFSGSTYYESGYYHSSNDKKSGGNSVNGGGSFGGSLKFGGSGGW